ncbi:heterogeneous nuclear ribonucleoprotein U-like protein 2 [Pholidichthys leucotaenia]
MKLLDIKKLKVAELKSRLQELGLDTTGLKAELVDRLWVALGGEQNEDEPNPQTDPAQMEITELPASSTPAEEEEEGENDDDGGGVPARLETELTETATEAETDPGAPTPQSGSESHTEEVKMESEQGPAEKHGGASSSEDTERGRAFYEFKEEIRYKRTRSPQPPVDRKKDEGKTEDEVKLDQNNCHLHFKPSPDGSSGQPRYYGRYPLLWSGCRLTHGVQSGSVGFEVRLDKKLVTLPEDQEATVSYGLRVGWSVLSSSLLLGEDELSFAYDSIGKKVSGGKAEEFGESFTEGDVISCYVSFSTTGTAELSFHKNGHSMGVAFSLDVSALEGRALFPHILCKSCSVTLPLDPTASPWYPCPPGFTPLAAVPADQRVRSPAPPTSRAECEMIMMVGLPGSGKSFWAKTYMKNHLEKQYKLLGTEELLACMISGGQKDSRLQQASKCLTDVIKLAAEIPANYILDQCNVLFSARRYKLQLFESFRRRAVVVFPSDEEWKKRLSEHEANDGEHIPEIALFKLQMSYSFPERQTDMLDDLEFVELTQEEAQKIMQTYKDKASRLLPDMIKQEKKEERLDKKGPHQGRPPSRRKRPLLVTPPRSHRQRPHPYGPPPSYRKRPLLDTPPPLHRERSHAYDPYDPPPSHRERLRTYDLPPSYRERGHTYDPYDPPSSYRRPYPHGHPPSERTPWARPYEWSESRADMQSWSQDSRYTNWDAHYRDQDYYRSYSSYY